MIVENLTFPAVFKMLEDNDYKGYTLHCPEGLGSIEHGYGITWYNENYSNFRSGNIKSVVRDMAGFVASYYFRGRSIANILKSKDFVFISDLKELFKVYLLIIKHRKISPSEPEWITRDTIQYRKVFLQALKKALKEDKITLEDYKELEAEYGMAISS